MSDAAEALFAQWVEQHVLRGEQLDPEVLCAEQPGLLPELKGLVARYLDVSGSLDGLSRVDGGSANGQAAPLPQFEGFRTIERIGTGGMGEVYKLHDLKLDRLAPSLEFQQRARIMKEVCEAVQHAHDVGVQHRDLKPSNIMLDAELRPKILDFGLSSGDPARGHFRGTPRYLAPEQLDASEPIDARTDVYALGAVLYELLTGVPPVGGVTEDDIVANVRAGAIRLPVEIAPGAPEPLQAIALKALEARPQDRYPAARDMALDLARFLDGRPVTARPSRWRT
jgi:serine/threonine protein kinase